ncbi:putative galacturonosyltransferase 15 [Sesbania bispinosa]|nr:putative galacturonosyltransferase 15 [Sesbania bispinosa]
MKLYVSSKGIKRVVTLSGKGSATVGRRISNRTVVVLGVVLLLAFVRVAVLTLESSAFCSSLEKKM